MPRQVQGEDAGGLEAVQLGRQAAPRLGCRPPRGVGGPAGALGGGRPPRAAGHRGGLAVRVVSGLSSGACPTGGSRRAVLLRGGGASREWAGGPNGRGGTLRLARPRPRGGRDAGPPRVRTDRGPRVPPDQRPGTPDGGGSAPGAPRWARGAAPRPQARWGRGRLRQTPGHPGAVPEVAGSESGR